MTTTMRALRVQGYGPGDGIVLDRIARPDPGPGQLRVRVDAAGISFVDLLVARGGYQVRANPPFTPGSEFSGVVDAIGAQAVTTLKVGDRVCSSGPGAWAEFLCADARALVALPAGASAVDTAVIVMPYATALHGLRDRGQLQAGETLLVLGAAGSVGHAAVQLGRLMGARVLAGASSAARRDAALAAGAHEVVDTGSDGWKDRVKALAGSDGVDVVFDPVGGAATDTAFRTLGWTGRHLMVGFASGSIGALKTNLSIVKGASLVGVDIRQLGEREPARLATLRQEVVGLYLAGTIRPPVAAVLPLERHAEATALVQDRGTVGRVLLSMEDSARS